MGCYHSLGQARVNEVNAVSERAFLRAVDGTLCSRFPNGGIMGLEHSIAFVWYGNDEALIAREQARLREELYPRHRIQMDTVAKAYRNAYICCCRLIGATPVDVMLNEAQLASVRDAIADEKSNRLREERIVGLCASQDIYVFTFNIPGEYPYEHRMAIYRLVAAHIVRAYDRAATS